MLVSANIAKLLEISDENTEDLLKRFNELDAEIKYRLPRRPYGVEPDEYDSPNNV